MVIEHKRVQANIKTTFKIDFQIRWNTTMMDMLKRFILLKAIVNDLTTNADIVPNFSATQQIKNVTSI